MHRYFVQSALISPRPRCSMMGRPQWREFAVVENSGHPDMGGHLEVARRGESFGRAAAAKETW